jgi:uncharacterized protein YraI
LENFDRKIVTNRFSFAIRPLYAILLPLKKLGRLGNVPQGKNNAGDVSPDSPTCGAIIRLYCPDPDNEKVMLIMNRAVKISSLLVAILLIFSFTPSLKAQEYPLALAFYYAWFDQNTWSSGQSVDLPAESYNSADRVTIERHVAQAQSAGLDGFVQAWYGPQEANNQTETNFRILLDVANARGFKAAVDVEVFSPFFDNATTVTNALATLLATHAQHPAYLHYQGKPVIFFWRQQRFSVDDWAAIRNQVDPDRTTYWIAEGVDIEYQAVFDGHHLYSIAWAGSPADQLAKWADRVRGYAADNQVERIWVATAMPGYDDSRLPRENTFAVPRRNGDYFRETWQAAIATQPDILIVTSFNEWLEGTQLEPSASYGNLYLDLCRELITAWRGRPPATPPPAELAASQANPPAAQEAQEEPEVPYIRIEGVTNVRQGPDTSFERIGTLPAGSTVPVTGQTAGGGWWLIDFPEGPDALGWVSAEVVDFVGTAADVPEVEAPTLGEAKTESVADLETGKVTPNNRPIVEIPAGGVNVRTGPGLEFDMLGRLEENSSAVVVSQNETRDWWQIEYEAGENGLAWVAAAVVDLVGEAESVPIVTVTSEEGEVVPVATSLPTPAEPIIAGRVEATDPVNVRAEPSLGGTLLGGLYPGESADALAISEDGEWWQIDFANGPEGVGWVAADFVRFQGDRPTVPIFGVGTPTPTPGPTDTPTPTLARPTPTPLERPATFAPTATSVFQATSAAILSARGTPDPAVTALRSEEQSFFRRINIPWGILSGMVVLAILWYQFVNRRRGKSR